MQTVFRDARPAVRLAVLVGTIAMAFPLSLAAQGAPVAKPAVSWVLSADWLQGGEISLSRSTIPSISAGLQRRSGQIIAEVGYLRAVREMSTVQGGFVAFGRTFAAGPVLFDAEIGVALGKAEASADTSGYHYTNGSTTGYQSRYTYSSAFAAGPGAKVDMSVPVGSVLELRLSVSEWAFSSKPLSGDNARLLAGAGFAVHLPRSLFGGAGGKN
jgi:hypothetical protein